jgi:hypothetical protein
VAGANGNLTRDFWEIEAASIDSAPNGKGAQSRYANLNLWWVEYATLKLRKFWRAEDRQRANDMRLQKHFYCKCTYKIIVHRTVAKKRPRNFDIINVGAKVTWTACKGLWLAEEKSLRRRKKRMITCLRTSDGTIFTTHQEIRNHITAFYTSANAERQQKRP